ncbi:unnamed protein product [Effrenium voratum]|nr:unnamed protein product [Effrenium voratum]
MRCGRCIAILAVLAVLLAIFETGKVWIGFKAICSSKPIEADFLQTLDALPAAVLAESQIKAFHRDGVLVVEKVLSEEVLERLKSTSNDTMYATDFLSCHGSLMALGTHGPIPSLASQVLGRQPVRVWSGQFFNKHLMENPADCGQTEQERNSFSKCDAPHMDLDGDTYGEVLPFVSIWFAMTEAHHSIGFLAGSHAAKHECGYSDVYPRDDCLVQLADNLTQELGAESVRSWHLQAGDVVIFYNQLFHYNMVETETPRRRAGSLRYLPADYRFAGAVTETVDKIPHASHLPAECRPISDSLLFPIAYPPEAVKAAPAVFPLHPRFRDILLYQPRYWARERFDWMRNCSESELAEL